MKEIWKSGHSKISNPIGLYDTGKGYAFFSRTDEGDFTSFVSEADLTSLLEKLKAEKCGLKSETQTETSM